MSSRFLPRRCLRSPSFKRRELRHFSLCMARAVRPGNCFEHYYGRQILYLTFREIVPHHSCRFSRKPTWGPGAQFHVFHSEFYSAVFTVYGEASLQFAAAKHSLPDLFLAEVYCQDSDRMVTSRSCPFAAMRK